ncbi:MAG: competence protein ComEA [Candidatus Saganbacteria bacterium]|uniref:Competence protein ComEA n=1 Tax=Candidatus Saganbacteria bacterium TaxID=2575572 RepID=A0A833P3F0_UNCSA|nr:MAG: competence protein ComEA [Candidatus Saganbacteria bacterium]
MIKLSNEQKTTVIGLVLAISIGSLLYFYNHFLKPAPISEIIIEEPAKTEKIVIHICGEIKKEGVYKLNTQARLLDAVNLAGGILKTADLSAVNLAEQVKDGQKIVIPKKENIINEVAASKKQENLKKPDKIININTATMDELDSLPGVGPKTAKNIIDSRPFSKTEELVSKIKRFGKNKFENIKGRITV